jgi:electron transport complex protein RnfC
MPIPPIVSIPTSMHIGAPAKPIVKAGEAVRVGQMIAEAAGFVSASVFSSVSGKVKRLDSMEDAMGRTVITVVIETDGEQTPVDGLSPRTVTTAAELADAARDCGLVGLGGAGFPTAVKLAADPERVEYILINGAECEPYITSDTRTMVESADTLAEGARLLAELYGAEIIFGVEKNKPEAIAALRAAIGNAPRISVKALPGIYPQGGEKVLVYNTIGRIIGEGQLPLDVGCIVLNCTTLAELMRFLRTGMPLVERTITVDGSAVAEAKNVTVPIGASLKDVFDFCGGFRCEPRKVLYGGPMMGITLPDLTYPVMKMNNAILAFAEKEAALPDPTDCIRCGKCADACPVRLTPYAIASAVKHGDTDSLAELKLMLCMECGCCSFICPARRPLVQQNKIGKTMVRAAQNNKGGK